MNTNEDNNLWDYSLKIDNELKLDGRHKLEFGLNYSNYRIGYRYARSDTAGILDMQNGGNLLSAYTQERWTLSERLTLLPGLRFSFYDVASRFYAEPRFQAFYKPGKRITLKASAGSYYQFVNRIVREDISAGSRDIWLLSYNEGIPVSHSLHWVAGGSYETVDYLFDVEAYYKKLNRLSEYTLRFAPSFADQTGTNSSFTPARATRAGLISLCKRNTAN